MGLQIFLSSWFSWGRRCHFGTLHSIFLHPRDLRCLPTSDSLRGLRGWGVRAPSRNVKRRTLPRLESSSRKSVGLPTILPWHFWKREQPSAAFFHTQWRPWLWRPAAFLLRYSVTNIVKFKFAYFQKCEERGSRCNFRMWVKIAFFMNFMSLYSVLHIWIEAAASKLKVKVANKILFRMIRGRGFNFLSNWKRSQAQENY